MTHALPPQEGERLTLGAPFSGELVITTRALGPGAIVSGLHALLPRTVWPSCRLSSCDLVIFTHKGQGRITVDGRHTVVVPGITVVVPRGAWMDVRNTGTGLLQLVWAAPTPALADFFRDYSRAAPMDAAGLSAMAQQHGLELRVGGAPTPPAAAPATGPSSGRRSRRRRRGRGTSRTAQAPPPPSTLPAQAAAASPAASPAKSPERRPPRKAAGDRPPRHRPHGRRRGPFAKEVFMNGRWVRVTGEGPMIASGE